MTLHSPFRCLISRRRFVGAAAALGVAGRLPAGMLAQEATPTPVGDPFAELLGIAPAAGVGPDAEILAYYSDLVAQTEAMRLERPNGVDADGFRAWGRAIYAIGIADPFVAQALNLTRDVLGYDLTDIDQGMTIGEPPDLTILLRGRFERAALERAWQANGYQTVTVDGQEIASRGDEAPIDLDSDFGRATLGKLDNAALLDDGTLVYARSIAGIQRVLASASGAAPSLGERVDVAALLATVDQPLANAVLVAGTALAGPVDLGIGLDPSTPVAEIATRVAAGAQERAQMPPVALALLATTPGGPLPRSPQATATPTPDPSIPDAQVLIRLLMLAPGTAEQAAAVVEERLATLSSLRTGEPYADLYRSWATEVLADGQVLGIELTPPFARTIFDGLFARDLLFIAW